ncbi:MAG: CoA transferase [Halioglobus sp.]
MKAAVGGNIGREVMACLTPGDYAGVLLRESGDDERERVSADHRDEATLWAGAGAQYLTGNPDCPPLPSPAPLATCAQGAWLALAALSAGRLDPRFPAGQLLGERAALLGLHRRGAISAGGACRLLDCADGQLALNLARDEDWQLLPAWLEVSVDSWEGVAAQLRTRSCVPLAARGRLLGLAVAASQPPSAPDGWFRAERFALAAGRRRHAPLVMDLTSLWAGPLCTDLLEQMGARVIKVESAGRPDAARQGSPAFFDLLNARKQSVVLDLSGARGRRQLRELLACADIVVESARPRALQQLGIAAADVVAAGNGRVWLSITGYGRAAPMGEWIAYGDDAGVAAGLSWLLHRATGLQAFCGDAIADPLTGLHAALAAWSAWTRGGGALIDVSLCGVVAHCIAAGAVGGATAPGRVEPLPPQARSPRGRAPALGSDTAAVLSEFGIG